MDWSASTGWWIAAGVLVAIEMATGTFYLLMMALGAAAGAIAGHLGLGFVPQLVGAALVGGGAVAAWHTARGRRPAAPPSAENRDVNLDVGERVQVAAWDTGGEGRIHYRGASWSVRFVGAGEPAPGPHVIRAVEGNRLLLERA